MADGQRGALRSILRVICARSEYPEWRGWVHVPAGVRDVELRWVCDSRCGGQVVLGGMVQCAGRVVRALNAQATPFLVHVEWAVSTA